MTTVPNPSAIHVHPYDGPSGRTPAGNWVDQHARYVYRDDLDALLRDLGDALDDLDRLRHNGLRNVGHVATRWSCELTLDAVRVMLLGVRDALQTEAQG